MSALPLPPSVLHGEVTGSLHSAEQVDSPDSDVDSIPLVGEVIFTPSPKTLRSKAAKRIFTPAPIAVPLDETGSFHVRLLATDDPSLEPTGWTYSVRFNLRAGATIDGYSISVPAGTVNDLADIAPVKPDNGVFYLRGPKGDTGETGPKGDKGDPGEPGPKGDPGELVVHAATHATGGSDPITPASIGAPDNAQVSGTANDGTGTIPFGPGESVTSGTVTALAYNGAHLALASLDGKADKTHATQHAADGSDPITPESIGAYPTAVGTLTGADNLDTLTTPGTYYLGNSSGVTTANGYPLDGWAGWIEVQNRLSSVIQKAYSIYTSLGGGSTSRNVWVRVRVGGTWHPWLRLDPGAVTPASIGAEPTIRDTGWRDVSSLADPTVFDFTTTIPGGSYLRWRRIGNTVHLAVRVPLAAGTVGTPAATRREGLINGSLNSLGAPANSYAAVGYVDLSSATMCSLTNSSTSPRLDVQPLTATGNISSNLTSRLLGGKVSWVTDDAWPSTLPGTPA